MNKLMIIDGNAILHRAYHALPPLTSNDGTPINAVYGFISMLLRLIENLKPTHIVVAWDTAKPTFRHSEYTNYQAQRPRVDSELTPQFQIAQDVLTAMNIPVFFCEGFEADDVIGTIVHQKSNSTDMNEKADEIVIVTGDRDILQLVNDEKNVKVFMPIKGITEGKIYGEKEVFERLKVKPSQVIDYKALVGDPSDNYPGVNGIGPKTAEDLLAKYETLENIFDNLWAIPEKNAKKLAQGAEPAGISKKLATIVSDVPVTFNLASASNWNLGSESAVTLFKQIGFKTLTSRIQNFRK